MIALPVFERLSVAGFGLYPGSASKPGLSIEMSPGLTLVLGANGLGKTTLVTLLYRMCTGPIDLPRGGGDLGGRKTTPRILSRAERRLFANRVLDGAEFAHASMTFTLGDTQIETTRSLVDLSLVRLVVDGEPRDALEVDYQSIVTENSGLPSYSDWLLLLRHITFYFEDRRALVWDPTAQRQILRLLFLPADLAAEWTALERAILAKDSTARNLQNVLGKEERVAEATEAAVGEAGEVRDELQMLRAVQDVDQPRLVALEDQVAERDSQRQEARLDALRAEREHESAYRDLERRQLLAISSAFPTGDETTEYLLAKFISDDDCLVCGHRVPEAADAMRRRLREHNCVICGSAIVEGADVRLFSPRAISRANKILLDAEQRLSLARRERDIASERYDDLLGALQELRPLVATRSARIDALVQRLPPAEQALHAQRSDLASMRARLEVMKAELVEARSEFSLFIARVNRRVVRQKKSVQDAFAHFAAGFLLESCMLAWHPHRDRVGESGEQIDFPAYELEMTGADFNTLVRRTGPEQVSESQREFIDLAFRMTLMSVATEGHVGSLVIDAPESSLDAVFVSRAAEVLTRFADPTSGNRLITTSNVVEGNLIPDLIRLAGITSPADPRIVNLFDIAAPTAATRQLSSEYEDVQRQLFAEAQA